MACLLYGIINFAVFLLLLPSCSVVVAYDGKLLSRICSGRLFRIGSNYQSALKDTVDDLASNTPQSSGMDYYCQHFGRSYNWFDDNVTLYGHGACTSSLSAQGCHDCIVYANSEMRKESTHIEGAQIKLTDCRLRYENYVFNDDV